MEEAKRFLNYHINLIYRQGAIFKLRLKTQLHHDLLANSKDERFIKMIMESIDKSTYDHYGEHDLYFKGVIVKILKEIDETVTLNEPIAFGGIPRKYISTIVEGIFAIEAKKNSVKIRDHNDYRTVANYIELFYESYYTMRME